MKNLTNYLDQQHTNALKAKAWNKEQGQKEVKNAAWETLKANGISVFDYAKICRENEQLIF